MAKKKTNVNPRTPTTKSKCMAAGRRRELPRRRRGGAPPPARQELQENPRRWNPGAGTSVNAGRQAARPSVGGWVSRVA